MNLDVDLACKLDDILNRAWSEHFRKHCRYVVGKLFENISAEVSSAGPSLNLLRRIEWFNFLSQHGACEITREEKKALPSSTEERFVFLHMSGATMGVVVIPREMAEKILVLGAMSPCLK